MQCTGTSSHTCANVPVVTEQCIVHSRISAHNCTQFVNTTTHHSSASLTVENGDEASDKGVTWMTAARVAHAIPIAIKCIMMGHTQHWKMVLQHMDKPQIRKLNRFGNPHFVVHLCNCTSIGADKLTTTSSALQAPTWY